MKVLLILVDGMRPDALPGIPEMEALRARSSYTLKGRTVFPSYTLPCHMSLFHSVDPIRHGTATNTYAPQVRPIEGLCEVLSRKGLDCAFLYSWEELRDLTRPGSLMHSTFINGHCGNNHAELSRRITDCTLQHLKTDRSDFVFSYLGWPDSAGHDDGWMTEEYLHSVRECWKQIAEMIEAAGEEYTVIVTADHGGHDRTHGTEMAEDMTVPVFLCGPDFAEGKELESYHITDLAPTIVKLLGADRPREWEGKELV